VQFLTGYGYAVRVACLHDPDAFGASVRGGLWKPSAGICADGVKSYLRLILLAQREALAETIACPAGTGFECSGTQRLRIWRRDEFIDQKLAACYIFDYSDGFGRIAATWRGSVRDG
jgi:hypothetical protein